MYNKIYPFHIKQNLPVRVRQTGQVGLLKMAVMVGGQYLITVEFDGGDRAEVWMSELALVEVKP